MEEDAMMNEDNLRVLEGTIVEVLEDEVLFVAKLNLSEVALRKTFDDWLASDYQSDVYRLAGIESDVGVGAEIRISFGITTMSIPPLAPVVDYEVITPAMEEDIAIGNDHLRTLEGTVVAILNDEIIFVNQINISKEALKKTAEEWFTSEHMSDIYRLTGIESDVSVGTELRISFAITTMSIPPLAPIEAYEVIAPKVDEAV